MDSASSRFRLDGKTALITGGAGAIGFATAETMVKAGARTVIGDVDQEASRRALEKSRDRGYALESLTLDISDEDSVVSVFAEIRKRWGAPEILVNCAGTGARIAATEMPLERWQRVIDVNLTGTFLCSREAAKQMLKSRKGSIVNVTSVMGLVGGGVYPNPAYQTSKGGIVNLTRTLALDWAGHGVRVNAVAPAFVRTPLTQGLLDEPGMEQKLLELTPMGRLIESHEVADAILFLASDAASMITGHTLPVDGGWVAQ